MTRSWPSRTSRRRPARRPRGCRRIGKTDSILYKGAAETAEGHIPCRFEPVPVLCDGPGCSVRRARRVRCEDAGGSVLQHPAGDEVLMGPDPPIGNETVVGRRDRGENAARLSERLRVGKLVDLHELRRSPASDVQDKFVDPVPVQVGHARHSAVRIARREGGRPSTAPPLHWRLNLKSLGCAGSVQSVGATLARSLCPFPSKSPLTCWGHGAPQSLNAVEGVGLSEGDGDELGSGDGEGDDGTGCQEA